MVVLGIGPGHSASHLLPIHAGTSTGNDRYRALIPIDRLCLVLRVLTPAKLRQ